MLRSVDVYVAPNTGGESFGIVLLEAMAAGAPVLASDIEAFRRVLDGRPGGRPVPGRGRPTDLAERAAALLGDPGGGPTLRPRPRRRGARSTTGARWPATSCAVYETVTWSGSRSARTRAARRSAGSPGSRTSADEQVAGRCGVVVVVAALPARAGRPAGPPARTRRAARDALDAQLVRRTAAAAGAGPAGLLDPATSVLLAEEAHEARRRRPTGAREQAESELSPARCTRPCADADVREQLTSSATRPGAAGRAGARRAGRSSWPPVLQQRGGRDPRARRRRLVRCAPAGRAPRRVRGRSRWTTARRRPRRAA